MHARRCTSMYRNQNDQSQWQSKAATFRSFFVSDSCSPKCEINKRESSWKRECVCVLHIHTYIRDVGRRLRALPNVTNVCNVNVGCRGETVKNSRYHATNAATADPRMLIRWSSPLLIPFSICIAAARIPKQHSSFFSYYYCKFTRVDNTWYRQKEAWVIP